MIYVSICIDISTQMWAWPSSKSGRGLHYMSMLDSDSGGLGSVSGGLRVEPGNNKGMMYLLWPGISSGSSRRSWEMFLGTETSGSQRLTCSGITTRKQMEIKPKTQCDSKIFRVVVQTLSEAATAWRRYSSVWGGRSVPCFYSPIHVCLDPLLQLEQCVGSLYPCRRTHTLSQISALPPGIRVLTCSETTGSSLRCTGGRVASSALCPQHNFSWLRHSFLINVSFYFGRRTLIPPPFPLERVGALHASGCEKQHIFH